MSLYPYDDIMRKSADLPSLRYRLVVSAKEESIKPTARLVGTMPKTVRTWVPRWKAQVSALKSIDSVTQRGWRRVPRP